MNPNFSGIYAVVCTPFDQNGCFDLTAAKAHLDWLISCGIKGVCLLGATGEYQSVSNEEHMSYLAQLIPYISDRVTVVVGVSRERPDDVIQLMNSAQASGASAAMCLSPFYCHPNQAEILENYRYIASKTTLPIILYNNPGSAGVDINRETLKAAMSIPSVKILKESTGSIQRLREAVLDAPEDVSVFCGCDSLALESFLMGAVGWISMAANFAPKDCISLLEKAEAGDIQGAMEVYRKLLPALELLESTEKPAATIKYILKKYRGLDLGHMRRPRLDLTEEEQSAVDAAVQFDTLA